jgi:hypothetical protein
MTYLNKEAVLQSAGNEAPTTQKKAKPLLKLEVTHKELFLLQTAVKQYGRKLAGKEQWSDITNNNLDSSFDISKGNNANIILLSNIYQRVHKLRSNNPWRHPKAQAHRKATLHERAQRRAEAKLIKIAAEKELLEQLQLELNS